MTDEPARPTQTAAADSAAAILAIDALALARKLSAGMKLGPGETARVNALPRAVRAAVAACWRPGSRYLPAALKTAQRVGPAPRGATLQEIDAHLRKMLPKAALARETGDPEGERVARTFRIDFPRNVPGAGRILQAVARDAGLSVKALRQRMKRLEELGLVPPRPRIEKDDTGRAKVRPKRRSGS